MGADPAHMSGTSAIKCYSISNTSDANAQDRAVKKFCVGGGILVFLCVVIMLTTMAVDSGLVAPHQVH